MFGGITITAPRPSSTNVADERPITAVMARHRAAERNQHHLLNGWHVGRSWPDSFPDHEVGCPCPKAPCGLAAPSADIPCSEHRGDQTMRQVHQAKDCRKAKQWWRT